MCSLMALCVGVQAVMCVCVCVCVRISVCVCVYRINTIMTMEYLPSVFDF